jgi:hypothetical protein
MATDTTGALKGRQEKKEPKDYIQSEEVYTKRENQTNQKQLALKTN